mgnify:CR=1 FL=1
MVGVGARTRSIDQRGCGGRHVARVGLDIVRISAVGLGSSIYVPEDVLYVHERRAWEGVGSCGLCAMRAAARGPQDAHCCVVSNPREV